MRGRAPRGLVASLVALGLAAAGPAARAQVTVCIDPGHGGSDPGAVGNGLEESALNLGAALSFRDWLVLDTADERGGGSWEALLTRDDDSDVSLAARCDYANGAGADYFTSIHTNAGGGDGTETYAAAPGGTAATLAGFVQAEVLSALGTRDRGVKYASFYVITNTSMPADLNEMAFIDVWDGNAELLAAPGGLEAVGLAHLHALQRMVGLEPYTPSEASPTDPTARVSFVDVPSTLDAGEPFEVTLAYETDLHAHGLAGQIGVELRDGESWEVLDEVLWDNDGAGVIGPAGEHAFGFEAPAVESEVFFVGFLTGLGGGWDERLADASTSGTPTRVEEDGGEVTPPPGTDPWVRVTEAPASVGRGEAFEVEVTCRPGDVGASVAMTLRVELLDGGSTAVDQRAAELLVDDAEATEAVRVTLRYGGAEPEVWLRACLRAAGAPDGPCVAEDETSGSPIEVTAGVDPGEERRLGCGACRAAPGAGGAGALALTVLALAGATVGRRRRGPPGPLTA